MKFYDRQNELAALQKVHRNISSSARLTVLTGRRRIGKTRLIKQFCSSYESLYFFISRKSEQILCEEYMGYIEESLQIKNYGKIDKLTDIMRLLFDYSKKNRIIVVIDEFQELLQVSHSFISEFQHIWDSNKDTSHLHLIVSGSVYSMMRKIFEDYRQPLYGRADLLINLNAFPIWTMKEILEEQGAFSPENLLLFYILTGGIPRYLEILRDYDCKSREDVINHVFSDYSVFADEGKNLLIEEFGKDYGGYFSILQLIATGKTSRVEIESILQSSVGGHLDRLEKDYDLISQFRPITAKVGTRSVKYKIKDPFMAFWFAFYYKYRSAVESSNIDYVKERFKQNYSQYAGYWLERLFEDIFKQQGKYNRIGSYWESGHKNEIDLVAVNDEQKVLVLAEIKMNKKNIRKEKLVEKSTKLLKHFPGYRVEYLYLGLEDLQDYI